MLGLSKLRGTKVINLTLMALGGLGLIVQFLSRKKQEHEKPLALVILQYSIMGAIILLGGYSQFIAAEKDSLYKRAFLEVNVLSKVSELYLPVLDDMAKIHHNMLTVRHYLSYEQGKKDNPDLARFLNWYDSAADSHKLELQTAQDSFQRIKRAAAEILKISIEYDGIIPIDTLQWVNTTLNMNFSEIENHFDYYAPVGEKLKASVLNYSKNTGRAFDLVIGRIRVASNTLKR